MPTTLIYTLSDPRTGLVRYVGKTRDPKARIRNHMNKREHNHNGNWIESLRKLGLEPEVIFIDEVPTEEWSFWEQHWIQVFLGWGFPLTNMNSGGGEHARFTPELKQKHKASFTEAVRQDMREKAMISMSDPEIKAKHSAATKLAMQRPEVKAKTRNVSEELRTKRSVEGKARWADPEKAAEMRRRMLVANASPEVKAKRRANNEAQYANGGFAKVLAAAHAVTSKRVTLSRLNEQLEFKSCGAAAKFLGVDRSVVSDCINGLRKRKGNIVDGWVVTEI